MAEGRMLKRRITLSKKMAALKTDKARLLWFYMLPFTDVDGRVNGDPEDLKDEVIRKQRKGYTLKKIQSCLDDLHRVGLIILYRVENRQYLQFTRHKDEQSLRRSKEAKSKIPAPLPEQSRTTPAISKVKISKVKLNEKEEINKEEKVKNTTSTTAQIIISSWQKLPLPIEKKSVDNAGILAIERQLSVLAEDPIEPLHESMILEAIENYKKALLLPESQTYKHTLYNWLFKGHVRKYTSYAFDIDHHNGSKFKKDKKQTDTASEIERLKKEGRL